MKIKDVAEKQEFYGKYNNNSQSYIILGLPLKKMPP